MDQKKKKVTGNLTPEDRKKGGKNSAAKATRDAGGRFIKREKEKGQ